MPQTRRTGLSALSAVVVLLVAATPAFAAGKGQEAGGKLTATISIIDTTASVRLSDTKSVIFEVTRSTLYDKETIWVTNKCWDEAGTLLTREDRAVSWGMWDSYVGSAGPFPTGGDHCTAFVTLRPWTDKPLKGAVLSY